MRPSSSATCGPCSRRSLLTDIVVLHDPQTAGLAHGLRETGVHVVWRCHVGRDHPNRLTEVAWEFLRPSPGPRGRLRLLAPGVRTCLDR